MRQRCLSVFNRPWLPQPLKIPSAGKPCYINSDNNCLFLVLGSVNSVPLHSCVLKYRHEFDRIQFIFRHISRNIHYFIIDPETKFQYLFHTDITFVSQWVSSTHSYCLFIVYAIVIMAVKFKILFDCLKIISCCDWHIFTFH